MTFNSNNVRSLCGTWSTCASLLLAALAGCTASAETETSTQSTTTADATDIDLGPATDIDLGPATDTDVDQLSCGPSAVSTFLVDGKAFDSCVLSLARRVDEWLYIELRVYQADPNAWCGSGWIGSVRAEKVLMVLRLPVPKVGQTLTVTNLEAHILRLTDGQVAWTPDSELDYGDLSGCLQLTASTSGYALDIGLDAKLYANQPDKPPVRNVQFSQHAAWKPEEVVARTAYNGECNNPNKGSKAMYVPGQHWYEWSIPLHEWVSDVEAICTGKSGCYELPWPPCGQGDRWYCDRCWHNTCLSYSFHHECLPTQP